MKKLECLQIMIRGGYNMESWIILNMRDCLKWGYNFKWFFENRKQEYLQIASEDDFKEEWRKQIEIMSRNY